MGKTRKNTNNNKINNKSQCYVLLSRNIDDQIPTEAAENPNVDVEQNESQQTIDLASFNRIHDATMESNELIKEIIFNINLLRQEVADLTNYINNGCDKHRKVPE